MAVKTYYGTCITAKGESNKIVVVKDPDITTGGFTFNIGDLLVVYFKNTNTATAPYLTITNGDTEQEVSIQNDTGKAIKTRSLEVDAVSAWESGETVIFAYTANLAGNDNNYYWEIVNGAPSTEGVYGVTKLYGNKNTNISDFLNKSLSDSDFDKALTPGLLKKLYNILSGRITETPTTTGASSLGLKWTPKITTSNMVTLGTLSLDSNSNFGVEIKYPLTSIIEGGAPKKTSQLANDGPDPSNSGNLTEDGKFYLTQYIPSSKWIYSTYNSNKHYGVLQPDNGSGNTTLRSRNILYLTGTSGITITPQSGATGTLTVNGNLSMPQKKLTCGAITSAGITASGAIDAGANQIMTTGNLKGKKIYENGTLLKEKYSGILQTVSFTQKIKVKKGGSSGHQYITLTKKGWTPIGIVGCNLNYGKAGYEGDATWCHLWEYSIRYNKSKYELEYAVRNHANREVTINAVFYVLYVKNT